MTILLSIISGLSISLDAICLHLVSNIRFNNIDFYLLSVQVFIIVYNILLIISMIFRNFNKIKKLFLIEVILRLFISSFYIVVSVKHLSEVNVLFYIFSYLNLSISIVIILNVYDSSEPETRRIQPQEEKVKIIIISERLNESEDNCSICLDPLKQTEVYKTKCTHIFHTECIKNYVNSNKFQEVKCPNCREILFNFQPSLTS